MFSAILSLVKATIQSPPTLLRLAVFAIVGIVAVYFGFFHFSAEESVNLIKNAGYYFMMAALLAMGVSVFVATRSNWGELGPWLKRNYRWPFFVLLGVLTAYLWISQEVGFKILMDEINLLGTSMGLHLDNQAQSVLRGYEVNGVFLPMQGFVDKRPLLYPFMVSLLHDFFGYKPENAFYLNLALIPLTLTLFYTLGLILSNVRGGLLAMILLACFPMYNLCSHGGGFEALNLFMILLTFLTSYLYLRRPEPHFLSLLCLTAVLLANVRYESILFVFPVALVVLLGYLRNGKLVFSYGLYATPLLLLPIPLLMRVFEQKPDSWQTVTKAADSPFGLEYVSRNFFQGVVMFFDTSGQQPVSVFLTCFGIFGAILFPILLVRHFRKPGPMKPEILALLFTCMGVIALMVLLLLYFWDFDDTVTRRLALPIIVLFVFPAIAELAELFKKTNAMLYVIGFACLAMIIEVAPRNAKDMYTKEYTPGLITEWQRKFIQEHEGEYNLVIDRPGLWVTHKVPAITMDNARHKKGLLKFHINNKTFDNIFFVESYTKDILGGVLRGGEDSRLDDDFVTEIVAEETFNGVVLVRIVRVVDIKVEVPDSLTADEDEIDFAALSYDDTRKYQIIQQARLSKLLP